MRFSPLQARDGQAEGSTIMAPSGCEWSGRRGQVVGDLWRGCRLPPLQAHRGEGGDRPVMAQAVSGLCQASLGRAGTRSGWQGALPRRGMGRSDRRQAQRPTAGGGIAGMREMETPWGENERRVFSFFFLREHVGTKSHSTDVLIVSLSCKELPREIERIALRESAEGVWFPLPLGFGVDISQGDDPSRHHGVVKRKELIHMLRKPWSSCINTNSYW
jgi:hypothetical protein